MAELDTGRPRPTDRTYDAALNGTSFELELFAHFWPAKARLPAKPGLQSFDRVLPWKSSGMMIFPPFDTPIYHYLNIDSCLELRIFPENPLPITRYVSFDDHRYWQGDLDMPQNIVCIVLYTETVQHVQRGDTAFGHYILAVKGSLQKGKFERLGIGVTVASSPLIPAGALGGRKAPTSKIALI